MNAVEPKMTKSEARRVLACYGISEVIEMQDPGGGTRNSNLMVLTPRGNFFLRRRYSGYCDRRSIAYEHALMEHLHRKGIVGPYPLKSKDGTTWVELDSHVYELHPFVEGKPFDRHNLEQLRNAGKGLGHFHWAVQDFVPPVERPRFRIDPPEPARKTIEQLITANPQPEVQKVLGYVKQQLERVQKNLPDETYRRLPHCVIHGDFHPGNVKFRGPEIAGIFDLDWASDQPRLQDVAYGLLYFAAERATDIDGADIFSLTQTCRIDLQRSQIFLSGYRQYQKLADEEISLLPDFMRIAWICCRCDGLAKVKTEDRIRFFTGGICQPLEWLDQFGERLITEIEASF